MNPPSESGHPVDIVDRSKMTLNDFARPVLLRRIRKAADIQQSEDLLRRIGAPVMAIAIMTFHDFIRMGFRGHAPGRN